MNLRVSCCVQPSTPLRVRYMPSSSTEERTTKELSSNIKGYFKNGHDLLEQVGEGTRNGLFYLVVKSRCFHTGGRKAQKSMFTKVKSGLTRGPGKVRRFKKRKIQPRFFWILFLFMGLSITFYRYSCRLLRISSMEKKVLNRIAGIS